MNSQDLTRAYLFGLGLVYVTLCGCSDSAAGDGVAVGDQRRGESRLPLSVRPAVINPAEDVVDASAPPGEEIDEPGRKYQWPNPDRSEIFLPPSRESAGAVVRGRDDHGVALVGFANVDRQRVLLRIDGTIAPLKVGDSRGGIQVLSIDPPEAMLKRGDREWTVKLFDTP